MFPYLKAHGAAVQKAAAQARQPVEDLVLDLLRRDHLLPAQHPAAARALADPPDARRDEEEHEAMVADELAKLTKLNA